jgi:hypothetical protein
LLFEFWILLIILSIFKFVWLFLSVCNYYFMILLYTDGLRNVGKTMKERKSGTLFFEFTSIYVGIASSEKLREINSLLLPLFNFFNEEICILWPYSILAVFYQCAVQLISRMLGRVI